MLFRSGNNVDLNRSYNLGPVENPDYVFFDSYLNPKSEFEFFSGLLRAFFSRIRLGEERARQAIAAGQMQAPYGLFFTGKEMQRELRLIQDIIKTHLASTKDLIVMDLHTGLGDFCGEMLFVDHDREEDSPAYFERIFGRPCNIPSPSAGSYSIHGRISDMFRHSLPHVKVRYCLQEFGTHSAGRVIGALRRENFEWRFRQAGIPPSTKVKELMLEAFLPKSPAWRENMLKLGKQRWSQAWRSLHQPSSN